jgi:hypothetical protein
MSSTQKQTRCTDMQFKFGRIMYLIEFWFLCLVDLNYLVCMLLRSARENYGTCPNHINNVFAAGVCCLHYEFCFDGRYFLKCGKHLRSHLCTSSWVKCCSLWYRTIFWGDCRGTYNVHPWPTPCRQEPGGLWVESHTNSDRSDQDRLFLLSFRQNEDTLLCVTIIIV